MMMTHAGGPGLISPLEYGTGRKKMSPATLVALGVVVAAHVGAGIALYYQRVEMAYTPPAVQDDPLVVQFYTPPPPKEPLPEPPAPNPPLHNPVTPSRTVQPLIAVIPDIPTPSTNPAITLTVPVPNPTPAGTGNTPVETVPAGPPTITNPDWVRKPTGEALMRAYPDRALQADVGGRATLNCLVQPNGRVADCNLMAETPGGYGFGRAAQDLTRHFQLNPRTVDGAAVGSRVNIGIRFTPPSVN